MRGHVWTGDRWARFTDDPGGSGGPVLAPTGWHTTGYETVALPSTPLEPSPWVEFVAATGEPTSWLDVSLRSIPVAQDHVIEVGVGPAGSETPISQWSASRTSGDTGFERPVVSMPVPSIPAGSRVSVRMWSTATDANATLRVSLGRSPIVPDRLYRWGMDETTGASAISVVADFDGGAWEEIVATSPSDLAALHVLAISDQAGGRGSAVEFGIGPAGSETPLAPQVLVFSQSSPGYVRYQSGLLVPVTVSAGDRVAVRAHRINGFENTLELVIHGVPA